MIVQRITAPRTAGEPTAAPAPEKGSPSAVPAAVADYGITPLTVIRDVRQPVAL